MFGPLPAVGACRRALLLSLAVLALPLGCSSSGGGSSGAPASTENVLLLTTRELVLAATGGSAVDIVRLFSTSDGVVLMNDAATGSILLVDARGAVSLYTSQTELTALNGESSASLGPLDEVLAGSRLGEVFGADSVSGLLFRLGLDGTPSVHATKAAVTAVTGAADSRLSLPRYLTTGQVLAQDLVSNDLIRFGTTLAMPRIFASAAALAGAAAVTEAEATVVGWTRSRVVNSPLFARFPTTSDIVKVSISGTVDPHVLGTDLEIIFPDVAGLRIVDFVADTLSDFLLVLIGSGAAGDRGVAVAVVDPDGAVAVFSPAQAIEDALGPGHEITDLGVLSDGVPYAIDRGTAQVVTFNSEGLPTIVGERQSVVSATGSDMPRIAFGAPVGNSEATRGVVIPDSTTGNLIIVE